MSPGRLVLLRHGLTEWGFAQVLISPLQRAQQTAALAGPAGTTDAALMEWDDGGIAGLRTVDIGARTRDSGWTIWTTVVPPGGPAWPAAGGRAGPGRAIGSGNGE